MTTAAFLVIVVLLVIPAGHSDRLQHGLVRDHGRIVGGRHLGVRHRIVPRLDVGRAEDLVDQVAADGDHRADAKHVQPLGDVLLEIEVKTEKK